MSVLYTSMSICVVLLGTCVWWYKRRAYRLLGHLPRYPALPIIGNSHQLLGDNDYKFKQLIKICQMMNDTQKPFASWLGPMTIVAVGEPNDVKTVTNAYTDKPYMYRFTHDWLGDGLITAPGSIWKHTSRKLSGVLNTSMVDGYQEIFNTQAQKLVRMLKTEARRPPFDVSEKYIESMALETIYYITLGLPTSSDCEDIKEYHVFFSRVLELYLQRALTVPLHLDFLYNLSSEYKEQKKCEDVLNGTVEKVIYKRREERKRTKDELQLETCPQQNVGSSFKSYVDVLLDLNESDPLFNHKQIMSELSTIIAAGHDTMISALTMSLLMIGGYPEVQEKLFAEIKEIFGSSKRAVTKDDLARMQYCEAVVNETLRLYPPVPVVIRQPDKDISLRSCTIPKEAMCAVNILAVGHSRNIWGDDVETFRPERWLENSEKTPFFIPFSYGKRACIGKKYSMAMLKTTLAYCVRELVIKADLSHLKLKVDITLKPYRGHLIQIPKLR